jgi:hypothetical protein
MVRKTGCYEARNVVLEALYENDNYKRLRTLKTMEER